MSLTLNFGGPETQLPGLDWFDPRGFGAMMDLRPIGASVVTSGSPVVTGPVITGVNGDVGKRVVIRGAGAVIKTASDGVVTIGAPARDNNLLTSASGAFTSALNGKWISIPGVGPAGATVLAQVFGVISPTQLRITTNCTTAASGITYTISDDLYATVLSNTTTDWTLDTNAGTSGTALRAWAATDDAAAINACLAAAAAAGAARGIGATVLLAQPCGITAPLNVQGPLRIIGAGVNGFSVLLGTNGTTIRAMSPKLNALMRVAIGGSGATGTAGCGMGVTGSISAGTAILTDLNGHGLVHAVDAGKSIAVIGAATQLGNQTQAPLFTTILSVDSPTQITLATNALTTVVEGVYSWLGSSTSGGFSWFQMESVHFEGAAGQKCGLHLIGCNGNKLENCTFSDYRGGVGKFNDPSAGGNTEVETRACNFNNCRIGVKGGDIFMGTCIFDGMDNQIAVMPPVGTIAIDATSVDGQGKLYCQAYEMLLRVDGRAVVKSIRCEAFGDTAIEIHSDGSTGVAGGNGNQICASSWSCSSTSGSAGKGLVLLPGVTNTVFEPGYYIPTNINMYGGSDATALLDTIVNDPVARGKQAVTFAASFTPNMALGKTITMLLTGNVTTIGAPLNAYKDATLRFVFLQDGTGTRTVAGWNAIYKVLNWTPNTGAGKRNTIEFTWDGTNWVQSGATVQT